MDGLAGKRGKTIFGNVKPDKGGIFGGQSSKAYSARYRVSVITVITTRRANGRRLAALRSHFHMVLRKMAFPDTYRTIYVYCMVSSPDHPHIGRASGLLVLYACVCVCLCVCCMSVWFFFFFCEKCFVFPDGKKKINTNKTRMNRNTGIW